MQHISRGSGVIVISGWGSWNVQLSFLRQLLLLCNCSAEAAVEVNRCATRVSCVESEKRARDKTKVTINVNA